MSTEAPITLSIEDVTNPTRQFGGDVLGLAMQKSQEAAKAQLVDLAQTVLARARNVRAQQESRLAELEAAATKVRKESESLAATMTAEVISLKSILPLAAELGMKGEVMDYMKRNSIVVPPNDSPVWKA